MNLSVCWIKVKDAFCAISKKEKEINQNIVKNPKHEEYIDVFFNKKVVRHNMERIQSKLYRTGTYDVCKISLSCFDDKRYILDDGINSLVYFHKATRTQ